MGVEYKHYLIAEDNTYKPGPDDLSRLIDALLDAGFVLRAGTDTFNRETINALADADAALESGCNIHFDEGMLSPFMCRCSATEIAALGERDYRIVWNVESSSKSGLRYPLIPFPDWGDPYYDLQLHVARDFVYHTSESIDPFDRVSCECGRSLDPQNKFPEWSDNGPPTFFDQRIPRFCPSCRNPFRPQRLVAQIRDGRTGEAVDRRGGATYLFAVVIDCGKGFARQCWPIWASDEFLELVTTTLGQPFYQVGEFY